MSDGLMAGAGIAVRYLALAQAAPGSDVWPIAAGRLSAVLPVAGLALALSSHPALTQEAGLARLGLPATAAGALAALALVCYLFATRTQFLAVAVVLSLYPVVPVVLGITVRERLHRRQIFGLAAALTASVLIAMA